MAKKHTREKLKDLITLKPAQILAIGFAVIILVGTLVLNTGYVTKSGESIGFLNALFTATSAVCVTGLVVQDTGSYWNGYGQAVILFLIQVGGLGFMTMGTMIFFMLGKRIGLKSRLLMQKALGQVTMAGIIRLTKLILLGTFIIEITGAALLATRFVPKYGWGQGLFYALFHAISAFCNAGFDLLGNSIISYSEDPVVNFTLIALIVIGGLGFTVLMDLGYARSFKKITLHSRLVLVTTGILLVSGFLAVLAFEFYNPETLGPLSIKSKILAAMFHSVTPRTAGFNSLKMSSLTMATTYITMVLMFIGGSPSSTAGGIKTTTFSTMVLMVKSIIFGQEDTCVFKRRLSADTVRNTMAVTVISLLWVTVVSLCLTVTENGASFLEILFETISAFATVGLSLGITGDLSELGKVLIIFTMFAGRVGPITLVLALIGVKENKKVLYRYPEDKVNIG